MLAHLWSVTLLGTASLDHSTHKNLKGEYDPPDLRASVRAKEPACQCRRHKRCGFNPWVGNSPWRRAWPLTPVFLPGESHGQRSLAGYGPRGCKELDMTEQLTHNKHLGRFGSVNKLSGDRAMVLVSVESLKVITSFCFHGANFFIHLYLKFKVSFNNSKLLVSNALHCLPMFLLNFLYNKFWF